MIGDSPCRSKGERAVSEGHELGVERLGEETEESDGAGQIPTDDGAPVLGRATGTPAQGGGAPVRWLRRGREENGAKRGRGGGRRF
jgi:hypothetical protein